MGWGNWLGTSSVPVLCYHNIGGNGVPRAAFAAQMRWLKAHSVKTLGLDELKRFIGGKPLDSPAVFLTFDDGFRDLYTHVGPLFKSLGFKGIVFAVNNRLREDDEPGTEKEIIADEAHRAFTLYGDRSAWLSGRELRALVDDGLFDVGGHSFTHAMAPVSPPEIADIPEHWAYAPWLEGLNKGPAPRLEPELAGPIWLDREGRLETGEELYSRTLANLKDSRNGLEELLNRPVISMAWPWGKEHPDGKRAACDAGLELLFTLRRGSVEKGSSTQSINRLEVRRKKGLPWFESRMFMYSRTLISKIYSAARI